jgi:hypothetical protein
MSSSKIIIQNIISSVSSIELPKKKNKLKNCELYEFYKSISRIWRTKRRKQQTTNGTKTKNPKKIERELPIHVDVTTRDQAALAEGARP